MWVLSSVSGPGAGREMGKWPVEDFYITLEMYSFALCENPIGKFGKNILSGN